MMKGINGYEESKNTQKNYLSCFTYIILRVLQNNKVICFGYKISSNMIGIQDGYNKNFHIECIEYYEKFDT